MIYFLSILYNRETTVTKPLNEKFSFNKKTI